VRDAAVLSPNFWSYVDAYDLADALVLAVESALPGHEVFYVASPDNVGNRPFRETVGRFYGDAVPVRALSREDASGISCAKRPGSSATPRNAAGATTSTPRAARSADALVQLVVAARARVDLPSGRRDAGDSVR
jgi:nucleoside-diphosphate-sugar epimerase